MEIFEVTPSLLTPSTNAHELMLGQLKESLTLLRRKVVVITLKYSLYKDI
jgi:hypothetical protein